MATATGLVAAQGMHRELTEAELTWLREVVEAQPHLTETVEFMLVASGAIRDRSS